MPTFDKSKINTGLQKSRVKLDLSHDHITTSNFMDLQPVMYRHMMPNEKIVVNARAFARLAPMQVPTYGRCRMNLRAFFVPFRTVMPKFTEYMVDTVSSSFNSLTTPNTGLVTTTPTFSSTELWKCFTTGVIYIGGQSYQLTNTNGTATHYDFRENNNYFLLTPIGRKFYKVIRSLGYSVIPDTKTSLVYSALALLSYLRVYFDWYSASAYMDTNTYQLFASWFEYDNPTTPLQLDYLALSKIATFVYRVCYDGDYFTAAWDNPVAPNVGLFSQFIIPDITDMTAAPVTAGLNSQTGTPNIEFNAQSGPMMFTQYADTALHALTDYMKAHQLAGARAVDRYLADFGINLPADKLMRSSYLGMSSIDIKVGDVMSHSETAAQGQTPNLGDYAGQGLMKGTKTFEFSTSEFGLFVIMSSIVPSQGYVQGYDRNNLHVTKDSFFNGRFDNLGVQTINSGELYVSKNAQFIASGTSYEDAFGYTPRYAEYKIGRDQLTGDISLDSVMVGGDSWHLNRMFDDAYFGGSLANVRHGLGFVLGNDADQYSRIFNSTDPEVDKFYIIYQFDEVAYAPCKSLFDTYDWDSYNKDVTLDSNGTKMN